jgi:uncharacterized membrane protein
MQASIAGFCLIASGTIAKRGRSTEMTGSQWFFIVFRLIHILAGVAWAGGVFLFVVFLQPSAVAVGPAAGPMMGQLLGTRKLVDRFLQLAAITIAVGLVMYIKIATDFGSLGDLLATGYGVALTVGMLTAIAAAALGMLVTRPNVGQLLGMQRTIADSGVPPTSEQASDIANIQRTLKLYARLSLALLVVTVAAMATARYW